MVGAKVNFLKLVCSSWRIWRLVLLKIVVVRVSRENFLSKSLGYGCLVVLPLMSSWVYHCGFYCCMLGKKERRFWVELGARYQAGRSNEVRVRGQWTEFLWWINLAW